MLTAIAGLPRPLLIVVVGLLVLGECTVGLGFVVPGESGLLLASASVTDFGYFLVLSSSVALFAAVGDTIGFVLGRFHGWRLRESRMVRKMGTRHWDRAGNLLRRYGIGAVFAARFLPVVRTLTPAAAGASGLGYARFLPASLVGAVCWSTLHVAIGWLAGASAKYFERLLGGAGWAVLGLLVAITATVLWLRRYRARRVRAVPDAGATAVSENADTADSRSEPAA